MSTLVFNAAVIRFLKRGQQENKAHQNLDNSIRKLFVDDKIYKANSGQNSRQPEDLKRDRKDPATLPKMD